MRQLILQLMSREKRGLKSGSHKSYFNFLQSSNPTATKYPKHGAKVHFFRRQKCIPYVLDRIHKVSISSESVWGVNNALPL